MKTLANYCGIKHRDYRRRENFVKKHKILLVIIVIISCKNTSQKNILTHIITSNGP